MRMSAPSRQHPTAEAALPLATIALSGRLRASAVSASERREDRGLGRIRFPVLTRRRRKRSSISKRRSKALPALGFAGMSLSMASGACASTSEASANTSLPSQKHEIFLGEEEISDVSLATFHVLDKENAGPPPLFQKLRLAAGG